MNNDSVGRTPEEKDEARHFYAVGTVRVRAAVDDLSEIAQKVDGKTRLELKRLRAQLVSVNQLIGYQTVFEMDNADTYSDSTPVSIVVGPRIIRAGQRPATCMTPISRGFPSPVSTTATTQMGQSLPDAH